MTDDERSAVSARRPLAQQQRGLRLGVAVTGLVVVAASLAFYPNLLLYLVGLGIAAIGVVGLVTVSFTGGRRLIAFAAVLALLGAAVVGPWWWAGATRDGFPAWTTAVGAEMSDVRVDGDRVLASTPSGMVAVGLADGEVRWAYDLQDRVVGYHVAADGHVLVIGGDSFRQRFAWLSPSGEVLWEVTDRDAGELKDLYPPGAVAAADGFVVLPVCTSGGATCTRHAAVGPDGRIAWDTEIAVDVPVAVDLSRSAAGGPLELPEVAVLGGDKDDEGSAQVRSVATGEVLRELELAPGTQVAVSGGTVVWSSAADGDGCRTHGWSTDGSTDWTATTPCLWREGAATWLVGEMLYLSPLAADGGGRFGTAVDVRTGGVQQLPAPGAAGVDPEPGADLVVLRDGERLTGIDPRTGAQRWQQEVPGEVESVTVGPGAVTVRVRQDGPGRNPWTAERTREGRSALLVLDAGTGEITGRTAGVVGSFTPAGEGAVIRISGEEISLVGAAQD